MRIGIFGGEVAGHGGIDEVVASTRRAADEGFATYWMPQIFGPDALTSLAVVGREVPRIEQHGAHAGEQALERSIIDDRAVEHRAHQLIGRQHGDRRAARAGRKPLRPRGHRGA